LTVGYYAGGWASYATASTLSIFDSYFLWGGELGHIFLIKIKSSTYYFLSLQNMPMIAVELDILELILWKPLWGSAS